MFGTYLLCGDGEIIFYQRFAVNGLSITLDEPDSLLKGTYEMDGSIAWSIGSGKLPFCIWRRYGERVFTKIENVLSLYMKIGAVDSCLNLFPF